MLFGRIGIIECKRLFYGAAVLIRVAGCTHRVGNSVGRSGDLICSGAEVDRTISRFVGAADIEDQLTVDEDPNVVITGVFELSRTTIGEPTVHRDREIHIHADAEAVVAGFVIGAVEGEEAVIVVYLASIAAGVVGIIVINLIVLNGDVILAG